MHILIGTLIVIGTFLFSMRFVSLEFNGFWNTYSIVLLVGLPIGLTIMTYRFSTLAAALRTALKTFTAQPDRDREQTLQRLVAFGREVRRARGAAASGILDGSDDPVFRQLGQHVLQSSEGEELETDGKLIGNRELEGYHVADRVLSTLGNTAPAVGMIGTVIGLIQLLANMHDFQQLGPGMAIALLTTFYGLLLAHLIYLPLARLVSDHGARRAETINLVVDGMLKLSRRRPLHEVQQAVAGAKAAGTGSGADVALGGEA